MEWVVLCGEGKNIHGSDMQEKKNKRLALLLIAMVSMIVVFAFLGNSGDGSAIDKSI